MRSVPSRSRRTAKASALVLAATLVLAGCGGGDDQKSPFTPPKGEEDAASSLGFPVVATRNTTRTATKDPVDAAASVASAAFPDGSDASRAKAVAIVDRKDWRSALAATALVAAPVTAPLLFSDGGKLPKATQDAIDTLKPRGSAAADGAQALLVGNVGRPSGLRAKSLEGADVYEQARAIDRFTTQARGRASDRVLIVNGDRPEFALPAAAWLAKSGDPVAFVTSRGVPAATARQLASHPRATLYVLGPSAVVRPSVTKTLRKYGTVKRVGGVTPVDNAVGFARYKDGSFGWNVVRPGHNFLVAQTSDTLGAITLAPLAASGLHGPLLLNDASDTLSVGLREYLRDIKPGFDPTDPDLDAADVPKNRAWLTGDVSNIGQKVQAQIDTLLEVASISRAPQGGDDGLPRGDEADAAPTVTTTPTPAPATPPGRTTSTTPTPRGR